MKVVNVEAKEIGTVAKVIRSTAAGLSTGYQRTNFTTLGISAVATTGGYLLIDVATLPWYSPSHETNIEIPSDIELPKIDELTVGYKAMAIENSKLAEESMHIALEEWPDWES